MLATYSTNKSISIHYLAEDAFGILSFAFIYFYIAPNHHKALHIIMSRPYRSIKAETQQSSLCKHFLPTVWEKTRALHFESPHGYEGANKGVRRNWYNKVRLSGFWSILVHGTTFVVLACDGPQHTEHYNNPLQMTKRPEWKSLAWTNLQFRNTVNPGIQNFQQ